MANADEMRLAFASVDADGDGVASPADLLLALRRRQPEIQEAEVEALLEVMDPEGSASIRLDGFMLGVAELELDVKRFLPPEPTPQPATLEDTQNAFDAVSRDGRVTLQALHTAMRGWDDEATEADALALLRLMPVDENGDVTFSGFVQGAAALDLDVRRFLPLPRKRLSRRLSSQSSMCEDDVDRAAVAFGAADEEGLGVIPAERLLAALQSFDVRMTERDGWRLERLLGKLGPDDPVELSEFCVGLGKLLAARKREDEEEDEEDEEGGSGGAGAAAAPAAAVGMRAEPDVPPAAAPSLADSQEAFAVLADGGDRIDGATLLRGLRRSNPHASEDEANAMIVLLGGDDNGEVMFADFVSACAAMALDVRRFLASAEDGEDSDVSSAPSSPSNSPIPPFASLSEDAPEGYPPPPLSDDEMREIARARFNAMDVDSSGDVPISGIPLFVPSWYAHLSEAHNERIRCVWAEYCEAQPQGAMMDFGDFTAFMLEVEAECL